MKKLALFLVYSFLLLGGINAFAGTFYIDYATGSNSNSGTSKTTPWKTHPFMQRAAGCTGSGAAPNYSHSGGDIFIFKQGSSWPNACFDMKITSGGTNGNPDQYTYDSTWGTAGGTSGNKGQAVGTYQFTAGGSVINGADGFNKFIDIAANYVTFNGVELTGMTWTGTGGAYGNVIMVNLETSQYAVISNCYAHGWTHPGATFDALDVVYADVASPYNPGSAMTGCVIDGANSGGAGVADSGSATYAIQNADNNIIRNMSNGLIIGFNSTIHDNLIGPINISFDPGGHSNCIEPIGNGTNYIYNNVWHDCVQVGLLTQGGAPSAVPEVDYLWNNVAYVGSVSNYPIPFQFDSTSTNMAGSAVYAYNNTIYGGAGACMRTANRGNGNFANIDLRNNHCITAGGTFIALGVTGNTYTNANNLVESSAANYNLPSTGNASSFAYSPNLVSAKTIGYGQNLSGLSTGSMGTLGYMTTYGGRGSGGNSRGGSSCRPSLGIPGCWDAGAYLFGSAGPAPPTAPSGLQAAVQ